MLHDDKDIEENWQRMVRLLRDPRATNGPPDILHDAASMIERLVKYLDNAVSAPSHEQHHVEAPQADSSSRVGSAVAGQAPADASAPTISDDLIKHWQERAEKAERELGAMRDECERLEQRAEDAVDTLSDELKEMALELASAVEAAHDLSIQKGQLKEELADANNAISHLHRKNSEALDQLVAASSELAKAKEDQAWQIKQHLQAIAAQPDEEVLAVYARTDRRREWWSGGSWLRPGDSVVVRSDGAKNEPLQEKP